MRRQPIRFAQTSGGRKGDSERDRLQDRGRFASGIRSSASRKNDRRGDIGHRAEADQLPVPARCRKRRPPSARASAKSEDRGDGPRIPIVWYSGSVVVTDFMNASLIVKAAIEAHMRRIPRRFSDKGTT